MIWDINIHKGIWGLFKGYLAIAMVFMWNHNDFFCLICYIQNVINKCLWFEIKLFYMLSNHISYSIYVISNGPLKWSSAKRTYYILLYGTMLFYVAHLPHILYSKKKKSFWCIFFHKCIQWRFKREATHPTCAEMTENTDVFFSQLHRGTQLWIQIRWRFVTFIVVHFK